MQSLRRRLIEFSCIGGRMKLRILLVLVAVGMAIMAPGALAVDTCFVTHQAPVPSDSSEIQELDLGQCDTVRIGEPICIHFTSTGIGDSFMVPIYIWNDYPIGGFSLGFHHTGQNLRFGKIFDVSNSVIPEVGRSAVQRRISTDSSSMLLGWIDFSSAAPVPASTGSTASLLGNVFIKLVDTTRQVFQIDSAFYPPAGRFKLTALFPYHGKQPPDTTLPISKGATPHFVACKTFTPPCDIAVPVQEVTGLNLPQSYALGQNVPNPFNPSTSIEFAVPRSGDVKIEVFNVLGQKVKTLADEFMKAGYKRVDWDGTDQSGNSVASGVYLYRMSANDFGETKKMLLLK